MVAGTSGTGGSEKAKIYSVGRKVPLVLQVIPPRTDLQMLGIDAAPIIAAVADHVVIARFHLVEYAEQKAGSCHLPPHEPHLAGIDGVRVMLLNSVFYRLISPGCARQRTGVFHFWGRIYMFL